MENRLNNGYLACIHYFTGETRYFGPYKTPNAAFSEIKSTWKLNVAIPPKEMIKQRDFRPVLSRKYRVLNDENGISAISIDVLEINQNKLGGMFA